MAETANPERIVLLIEHDAERARAIIDLAPPGCQIKVLDRITTAVARLGGGGVSAILLDISCGPESVEDRLEAAKRLQAVAPDVPIIFLATAADAAHAGTRPCVSEPDWATELAAVLDSHAFSAHSAGNGHKGQVIAFMGAKGGAGVTTLALAVAHSLSAEREVILAEMDPGFGSLCEFLNPPRAVSDLWQSRMSRNLRIAFRTLHPIQEFASAAEYVIVDLPPRLTSATSKILASADAGVIVVERDQIACAAAGRLVQALTSEAPPRRLGFVLVTKVPLVTPVSLSDFDQTLGIDRIGVVPPAADLCAAANRKHTALTAFNPESAAARAISEIAAALA